MLKNDISKRISAVLAIMALSLPPAAFADDLEDDYAAARDAMEMSQCFDATYTFTGMESCVYDKFEFCRNVLWDGSGVTRTMCNNPLVDYVDEALNVTYQELIDTISQRPWSEQSIDDLRVSQRSWIETRDLSCEFYENAARGTGSTWYATCFADLTLLRIWALKGFDEGLYISEG